MIILSQRSRLIFFLSDLEQIIGVISFIPISVAFSKNHSNLFMFFVGAIAKCKLYLCCFSFFSFFITFKLTVCFSISSISAINKIPLPLIIFILSPTFFLSTFTICLFSSFVREVFSLKFSV